MRCERYGCWRAHRNSRANDFACCPRRVDCLVKRGARSWRDTPGIGEASRSMLRSHARHSKKYRRTGTTDYARAS